MNEMKGGMKAMEKGKNIHKGKEKRRRGKRGRAK